MHLREIDGDNQKQHLVEVKDGAKTSQMSREAVENLKEREDIRVADKGDTATVLHKIRG